MANLGSPAITKYVDTNIESTLDNYYSKSYDIDYICLYNNIIEYYNNLLIEIPYKIELKIGCITNKSVVFRETKSISNIDHFFWINYYLDLRNIELGMPKGKSGNKKIKDI